VVPSRAIVYLLCLPFLVRLTDSYWNYLLPCESCYLLIVIAECRLSRRHNHFFSRLPLRRDCIPASETCFRGSVDDFGSIEPAVFTSAESLEPVYYSGNSFARA